MSRRPAGEKNEESKVQKADVEMEGNETGDKKKEEKKKEIDVFYGK